MKRHSWREVAGLFAACVGALVFSTAALAQNGASKAKKRPAPSSPPGMQIIKNGVVVAEINIHGGQLVLSSPAPASSREVVALPQRQAFYDPAQLYDPIVQQAAWRYGMDPDLLHAVIKVESNYNPLAVSSKGATGLMQIMPATGADLGFANPRRDLLIPANNIDAGARYLAWLTRRFDGDLTLALAAYNAGIGAVSKNDALSNYPETRKYVRSVLDQYQQAGLTALLRAGY